MAHSQGNLFVNVAHAYALDRGYTTDSLKVVHVAPATPILNGPHVLSSTDKVIDMLRKFGSSTVPTNNVVVDNADLFDPRGHSFEYIYMNDQTAAYSKTTNYLWDQWNALSEGPISDAAFKVSMAWAPGISDLDLWVGEAGGGSIANSSVLPIRYGNSGFLAENSATGPEIYSAYCDPQTLTEGNYNFWDANHSDYGIYNASYPYSLQVEVAGDVVYETNNVTEYNKIKPALGGLQVQRWAPDSNKYRIYVYPLSE